MQTTTKRGVTRNIHYISRQGLKRLRQKLRSYKRQQDDLRAKLSEFSMFNREKEYDIVNDRMSLEFLKEEIERLQATIANCKVVKKFRPSNRVKVGATVHLAGEGQIMRCRVVSEPEVDPVGGKISDTSPLGRALLGKMVNSFIKVAGPRRDFSYRIVGIEYSH